MRKQAPARGRSFGMRVAAAVVALKALRTIRAKTLILAGQKDLLNPEWEPLEASRHIRDVRYATINPQTVTGHASAGGVFPADIDALNADVGAFLEQIAPRAARGQ